MTYVAVGPKACPECLSGNHDNCDGRTWDDRADAYADCPCAGLNHVRFR